MGNKKVSTITLEYDRGDGQIVSEAFQAEFNNAFFNGRIEAYAGTFSGVFTANAINIIRNLTIAGGSAAVTSIIYKADASDVPFNDDGVFRSVADFAFQTPPGDLGGGWLYFSIQYHLTNTHNSGQDRKKSWPTSCKILVNGTPVNFNLVRAPFGTWWMAIEHFKHDAVVQAPGPGTYRFDMQFAFDSLVTNIYPFFSDIYVRVDYVRK